jgi:ABC-type branched-subunit amino acid transport system permease subunit
MLQKDTLRYGFYIAIVAALLALTGILGKLQARFVFADQITLSAILLIGLMSFTGYYLAHRVHSGEAAKAVVNGAVGGLVVALALSLLMVAEATIDLTFVFENLKTNPIGPSLTFGLPLQSGIIVFVVLSTLLAIAGAVISLIPERLRLVLLYGLALTCVIGLLEPQINRVVTLADGATASLVFGITYYVGLRFAARDMHTRLLIGVGVGAACGLLLGFIASAGGAAPGGILRGGGDLPRILGNSLPAIIVIYGLVGGFGALVTSAPPSLHNAALYIVGALVVLGVLNWQVSMTYLAALLTFAILAVVFMLMKPLSDEAEHRYEQLNRGQQQTTRRTAIIAAFLLMLVVPIFMGQYVTSVLDQVGLYIIMGVGLNVVIGYAGLLDLGYVAFFALGAYTVGVLTTPSLVTCGGVVPRGLTPDQIKAACTGVLTFWQAWPLAVGVAALAGILLGIPVLRLRGDYLAIVTLGFGEIIRLITVSNDFKPLLGAAQGISNIPGPVINLTALNPAWKIELGNALNIYYLILAGVLVTGFIVIRLANTKLGRAWRAMRADEDVAQAMGIHLTRTKLLAFAVGAACAGMGGAVFGSWLQGIFPNSFTIAVSINVVSLIIIGGLGSVPGVVLGSLILIGLPEVLRELQDYRLLAFGLLLVGTMLLKPEGLLPPPVRHLSEAGAEGS